MHPSVFINPDMYFHGPWLRDSIAEITTCIKTHIKTSSIQIHLIVSDIFILLSSFSTALQEKTVRTSPENQVKEVNQNKKFADY